MTKPKTTPHAKRGPKPKPKPPKRGRGRPEVELRLHPDRFAIALSDVMRLLWSCGGRESAVHVIGVEEAQKNTVKSTKITAAMVKDQLKAAEQLRSKARYHELEADLQWRKAISEVILCTIIAAAAGKEWRLRFQPPSYMSAEAAIVYIAESVGEADWARRVLLPLIELPPPPPSLDLTERDMRLVRFSQEPPLDEGDDADRDDRLVRAFVKLWLLRIQTWAIEYPKIAAIFSPARIAAVTQM